MALANGLLSWVSLYKRIFQRKLLLLRLFHRVFYKISFNDFFFPVLYVKVSQYIQI